MYIIPSISCLLIIFSRFCPFFLYNISSLFSYSFFFPSLVLLLISQYFCSTIILVNSFLFSLFSLFIFYNLDNASAFLFLFPGLCLISKLYRCKFINHLALLPFGITFIFVSPFNALWSVMTVNFCFIKYL